MTRARMIALAGAVLLIGFAVYDRKVSTSDVIPATVVSLEPRQAEAGPESWHISARTEDGLVALKPLHARPDLAAGDAICVTRVKRRTYPTEYRRAAAGKSC